MSGASYLFHYSQHVPDVYTERTTEVQTPGKIIYRSFPLPVSLGKNFTPKVLNS